MATPTTALANVRAVKSWMDKPFTDFNDTATTVYGFECVCSQDAYEANKLTYGTKLSSAVSAGLIEIIYTDLQARWVGDSNFSYHDGGYIRFLRKFARVPVPHVDYSTTVITRPPTFGRTRELITTVTTNPDDTTTTETSYGPEVEYVRSPARSIVVRSKLEYQYSTNPALLSVFTERSFSIVQNDGFSTVQRSGNPDVYESTQITRWMGDIYQAVTAVAY